jgi:hypothetical protein
MPIYHPSKGDSARSEKLGQPLEARLGSARSFLIRALSSSLILESFRGRVLLSAITIPVVRQPFLRCPKNIALVVPKFAGQMALKTHRQGVTFVLVRVSVAQWTWRSTFRVSNHCLLDNFCCRFI